ncbi:MAG: hypothetical protein H8E40_11490 [Chloroflexi bacterium]|nr:hypothetical protein [Chloroflexota bacterium]
MFQSYKPTPKPPSEQRGMLPSLDQIDRRRRFHYSEMVERGGWRFKLVFYLTLIVILIVVAVPSVEAYGYGQLRTSFQAQECSPVISTGGESVASTIVDGFNGDLLAAADDIITGLNVQGVVTLRNPSFVPLYIPATSHRVAFKGVESQNVVWADAMWLAPGSRESKAVSLQIDLYDLPQTALRALAYGGTIQIEIVSEIPLGQFSVTKTAVASASVSQPLSSYMK